MEQTAPTLAIGGAFVAKKRTHMQHAQVSKHLRFFALVQSSFHPPFLLLDSKVRFGCLLMVYWLISSQI